MFSYSKYKSLEKIYSIVTILLKTQQFGNISNYLSALQKFLLFCINSQSIYELIENIQHYKSILEDSINSINHILQTSSQYSPIYSIQKYFSFS